MTMFALFLALAFVAVLAAMSWRAARGLTREMRLPMQWGGQYGVRLVTSP